MSWTPLDRPRFLVLVGFLMLATGCAREPTLGNLSDPEEVRFQRGVTHKTHVLDTLGLPAIRAVKNGREYWGYSETPQVTLGNAYFRGLKQPFSAFGIKYVFVFDRDGFLVDGGRWK